MYYLMKKDHTEFTGLESYVYDQIIAETISWVPLLKCRELIVKKDKHELEESIDNMIKTLQTVYRQITTSNN